MVLLHLGALTQSETETEREREREKCALFLAIRRDKSSKSSAPVFDNLKKKVPYFEQPREKCSNREETALESVRNDFNVQ